MIRLADANAYADLYLSKQSLFKWMLAEIDIVVYAIKVRLVRLTW